MFKFGDYELQVKSIRDTFVDTNILYKGCCVGIFDFKIGDNIFMRQIRIEEEHKRKGHATAVIDGFLSQFKEPVTMCVAQGSKEAVVFWQNYFFGKDNVKHLRGSIYEIYPKRSVL